ncbi:hypothetical protein BKA69DRAFT_295900 [Paraphysoderma sedebokerense]|nr:hypothetical protein BKA69DRAFT_295900 [Paraphysoderma sedebokerense]
MLRSIGSFNNSHVIFSGKLFVASRLTSWCAIRNHHYLIHAPDVPDSRRQSVRQAHLDRASKCPDIRFGGAILDEENGKMIGSSILIEGNTKDEILKWIKQDPYWIEGVWDRQKVRVDVVKLVKG